MSASILPRVSIIFIMTPKVNSHLRSLMQGLITVGGIVHELKRQWYNPKMGMWSQTVEFDDCPRGDCRAAIHGDWADNLIKKLIVEGWPGCAEPAISFRQAYYALTADADGPKRGCNQRHSYMTASARIEEAIPGEVLGLIKRTGYDSIYRWDGMQRDLYALSSSSSIASWKHTPR